MKGRILVVDDDRQIVRMLRASLQASGYDVATAQNGIEALSVFQKEKPDLVITDVAMPEMDGVELTRSLRRSTDVPIIVLSVRDGDQMKVTALDEGADDYMTKPFGMPELLARVRAQLRRRVSDADATVESRLAVGDFLIDIEAHRAIVRGEEIHLTPKEFDLLVVFAKNPSRVLTHKTLLHAVWGPAGEDQPDYLRVLIAQLRKKIELPGEQKYVRSEPWVGYRFHADGRSELTAS